MNIVQENDIIIIEAEKGELIEMTKDELESEIFDSLNVSVDITDAEFLDFKSKGRLDIKLKTQETISKDTNSSKDILSNVFTENKEGNTKREYINYRTEELSIFDNGCGMDTGEIIMPLFEKGYLIWEALIKRGKCAYKINHMYMNDQIYTRVEDVGIIPINLLHKIANDIEFKSTGMDCREVRSYNIKFNKEDNTYNLMVRCIMDDDNGDIIGKYKLRYALDIAADCNML